MWNPREIILKKAKNDILSFHMEGRSESDIIKMFLGDPVIKVKEIMK
jgi:hypothetical protein